MKRHHESCQYTQASMHLVVFLLFIGTIAVVNYCVYSLHRNYLHLIPWYLVPSGYKIYQNQVAYPVTL